MEETNKAEEIKTESKMVDENCLKKLDDFIQDVLYKYKDVEEENVFNDSINELKKNKENYDTIISHKSTIPDLVRYNKGFEKYLCFYGAYGGKQNKKFPRKQFCMIEENLDKEKSKKEKRISKNKSNENKAQDKKTGENSKNLENEKNFENLKFFQNFIYFANVSNLNNMNNTKNIKQRDNKFDSFGFPGFFKYDPQDVELLKDFIKNITFENNLIIDDKGSEIGRKNLTDLFYFLQNLDNKEPLIINNYIIKKNDNIYNAKTIYEFLKINLPKILYYNLGNCKELKK